MDIFFDTIERLTPQLHAGDFAGCEREAIETLVSLPTSPFHIAASLTISNELEEAAHYFDRFYQLESQRIPIKAIYTEMNGFDINPDCWYCDLFAYSADGGLDDLDWLSDWESDYIAGYTITGFEQLQAVYASDAFRNPVNEAASYMSSLVVVTKFQHFMQRAAAQMSSLRVPLYVTAHDFDYMARIEPTAAKSKETAMGVVAPVETPTGQP